MIMVLAAKKDNMLTTTDHPELTNSPRSKPIASDKIATVTVSKYAHQR